MKHRFAVYKSDFFLMPHISFLDAYVQKKKRALIKTEITVLLNSCICRRITAPKILTCACQAELLHSENFS